MKETNAPPPHLLVAEGEAALRALIGDFLRSAFPEAEVSLAGSACNVVEMSGRYRPLLVVLDLSLPEGGGIAALASLIERLGDARVIVLSDFEGIVYAERAREAGAYGYLLKERIPSALLPMARGALDGLASGGF